MNCNALAKTGDCIHALYCNQRLGHIVHNRSGYAKYPADTKGMYWDAVRNQMWNEYAIRNKVLQQNTDCTVQFIFESQTATMMTLKMTENSCCLFCEKTPVQDLTQDQKERSQVIVFEDLAR